MARSAIATRSRARALPGERLGYPAWHGITGNMPVITQRFHVPAADAGDGGGAGPAAAGGSVSGAGVAAGGGRMHGTTAFEWWSGNMPVLSRDLLAVPTGDDGLMPGWVRLHDPILRRTYWWNSFYSSRRESRPTPRDDGRVGAGLGETEGKLLCAAFVRRVSSGVRARECVCWGLRAHSIRASPTARRRTVARPLTPTHCSAGFFARGVRGHARAPREDTGAVVGCHCRRRRRRGGGRHVRAQRRRGCGCTLAWRLYAGT